MYPRQAFLARQGAPICNETRTAIALSLRGKTGNDPMGDMAADYLYNAPVMNFGREYRMKNAVPVLLCSLVVVLAGCTQNMHGSFTRNTYRDSQGAVLKLGEVEGRSCQTRVLYALPKGERATTAGAVHDAMSRIENTEFLADMSIDDEVYFGIGYSRQCIVVTATAYGPVQ